MSRRKKRPFLLLEVMIAFAIVALCMLPLIVPNVWMITVGRSSIRDLEQERYVNLIYASIVEKLYENKIPWSILDVKKTQTPSPWTPDELPENIPEGWNYIVQVFFKMIGRRENDPDSHLLEVKLYLQRPNNKPLTYTYLLYLEKKSAIKNGKYLQEGEIEDEEVE